MKSLTCPECGAAQVEGMDCWGQLGVLLAWEWQDPELLAVHFLTVASYNLQHPTQFTDAAIQDLQAAFIAHMDQDLPVATIRHQIARIADGPQRVRRSEVDRRPVLRAWAMTINDVYLPDQLTGAADRVRRWAAAIRAEM
ncbi:MAG: hypothetical protein KF893_13405 [Caldilineaceae bacterium]|nr:hypothetical protein [Caldilineaceae bacterium]